MTEKKTYHFISHTHWDREWYLTFQQFRFRLVQLVDHMLDLLEQNSDFNYFHLDGQTIVLEDYLEIRPQNRARLQKLIAEGRILIGPWYQQNDLFLTSAESTVRSLIEGIRTSREWGKEMKVGYLPDHFGLTGQMPQIFRGVGIDNCVFGRGYDYQKHGTPYFYWQSPDGSAVFNILMTHWYNNAQRLPTDRHELKILFESMRNREEAVSSIPHYLMMNGVDHLEAQENLPEVLDQLRDEYGNECEFVHDTLPHYVQTLQEKLAERSHSEEFPVIKGELREREDYAILSGTLSSRIYVKQANLECHDLIEKWVEPLSTWCQLKGLDTYDFDYIRYLWKSYMKNHPHDSICGCSQDAVHEHMMDRYAEMKETANEIIDRKLEILANQVDESSFDHGDQKLVIANTSQLENHSVIQSSVYFLAEDDVQDFAIEDEKGQAISYRIVAKKPRRIPVYSPINLPGVLETIRYDIEWQPIVPAMGYSTYRVRPGQAGNRVIDNQQVQKGILENEYLKVEVQKDGTFHMTDKKTGDICKGLGQLEDTGDRGDLYVCTPTAPPQVWKEPVEWIDQISNSLYDECSYRLTWHLPAGLNDDHETRQKQTVPCQFQISLRLDKDSKHLNMNIQVDNQARDHRVRVLFPMPEQASHVWAGGQFDVVERSWDAGREWERGCYAQPYWKWVAPLYHEQGMAITSKGLHEYEMMNGGDAIALTLLRSVENIHGRHAVPLESDIQPNGQCLGTYTFNMAIRPFKDVSPSQLYQEAERFHQGLKTKTLAINDPRWDQGRAWVQDADVTQTFTRPDPNQGKERLPLSDSIFKVDGKTMISAVKWADDGQGPLLRLYNVESEDVPATITLEEAPRQILKTNLLEEEKSEIFPKQDELKIEIASKKIESYKIIV